MRIRKWLFALCVCTATSSPSLLLDVFLAAPGFQVAGYMPVPRWGLFLSTDQCPRVPGQSSGQ
jgi:hypothetical protein